MDLDDVVHLIGACVAGWQAQDSLRTLGTLACASRRHRRILGPVRRERYDRDTHEKNQEILSWIENSYILHGMERWLQSQRRSFPGAPAPRVHLFPSPMHNLWLDDWQFRFTFRGIYYIGMIRVQPGETCLTLLMDWGDYTLGSVQPVHCHLIKQFRHIRSLDQLQRALFETDWLDKQPVDPNCTVYGMEWLME